MSDIVVITGAAGALGRAVSARLAKAGASLLLLDIEPAKKALDEIAASLAPAKVHAAVGDFSSRAAWDGVVQAAESELGAKVVGAALIAGGWKGGKPLHASEDDAAYDAMVKQNLDTVYFALRALLPGMVANDRGSVVVVGSRAAERPDTSAGAAAYAASKAAVVALARAVAEETKDHHVRVNAILPSTMDTPANRASMPKADFTKWVTTDSAASVIEFLLSDASRDVSGAAVPVYGRA